MSEDLLREHFEVNYFSPILITKKLLPFLKNHQRVLHISSGAADIPLPGLMPYCATKAALEQSTRCLNAELNSQNIYFANLRPGMMDTSMQTTLREANEKDLPGNDYYIQAKENNQLFQPEKVAKFVAHVMLETNDEEFIGTEWNVTTHVM